MSCECTVKKRDKGEWKCMVCNREFIPKDSLLELIKESFDRDFDKHVAQILSNADEKQNTE